MKFYPTISFIKRCLAKMASINLPFFKDKHIKQIVVKDIVKIIKLEQLQAHEVASMISYPHRVHKR